MKILLEQKQLTETEILKKAWNEKAKEGYWEYKEGERDHFPPAFEYFYLKHKDEFKDALDVGCGSGRFLIPMVQDGLNVTGLDISNEMLNGAKGAKINLEKAKDALKGKVKLVEGESKRLPFSNESFNLVFSKGTISHNMWKGVKQSFGEATRVLRPEGIFIFQGRSTKDTAVSRADLVPDVGITVKDREGSKKGVIQHYFSKEELELLATQNGLEIVVGPKEISVKNGRVRWWVVYRKI